MPDLESLRRASGTLEGKVRGLLERLGQEGVNQSVANTSRLDGKDHTSRFRAKPVDTDLIRFYWDRER